MADLRAEFWALPFDLEARPLPAIRKWTVSPTDGEAGLVEIEYPEQGTNYDLLEAVVDDDVDLEVEVTITDEAGDTWTDHAILDEADLDDVAETGVGTFRGRLLSCLFDEVVMPYAPGQDKGETPAVGTGGRIARDFLEAAQARGCLEGVWWTFTDSHDSAGQPWAREGSLRFSPGQTYRAMLGTLRGYQLSEWRLSADRELQLYNPDGNGIDRTAGPNPLTLERGRDLGDAPRKWRLRGAITDLLSNGKDGLYSAATNDSARSRRRRRIEGFKSFGNTADQGTLDALTARQLDNSTAGRVEVSHKLVLGEGNPTPLIDFDTADWLYSATKAGVSKRRVRQITLEGTADEVKSCAVTMGVLLDDIAVRQQQQIDALASGEAIAGTSQPPPEVDDGSTPDAPDGLVANSMWYSGGGGPGLASITATWQPVPDARVVGYLLEWRYTDPGLGDGWQRVPQVEGTSATWSGVNPGAAVQVRVYAVNRWGRYSPASATYTFTTETDGTPPPPASAPAPYPSVGQVWVPWDGAGSSGEPMPGDFLRAELHRSTTDGFTAHRPLLADGTLDEAASTTYRGEMRAGMTVADEVAPADYGTTFYYVLVTVDRSANAEGQSAQGAVVPRAVQDGEVAGITAGKITAGIINAIVGIGQRLYAGDPAGPGWEGDPAGFRFWTGTGTARKTVLDFVASTGVLSMLGRLVAGLGAGLGATIIVEPGPPPRLVMYPNATQQRVELKTRTTFRPGGGNGPTFELNTLNSTGAEDGPQMLLWDDGMWLFMKDAAGNNRGGRLVFGRPGGSTADNDPSELARLTYELSNGTTTYLQAASSGLRFHGRMVSDFGVTDPGMLLGNADISSQYQGISIGYGATVTLSMNLQVTVVDTAGVNPGYVSQAGQTGFTADYETARNVSVCWQAWGT